MSEAREKTGTPIVRPNLVDRVVEFVNPVAGMKRRAARQYITEFSYEGAITGIKRGNHGGMGRNANPESPLFQRERLQLMWASRHAENNMPVIACVFDRLPQYAVGKLLYRPLTGDDDQNRLQQGYIENWMEHDCDLTGRHDFRTLTELVLRSVLRDGDVGGNKVLAGEQITIQLIEADRIGDPSKTGVNETATYTAGLHLDEETSKVVGYAIYDRDKNNRYTKAADLSADQFVHVFRPTRVDQYRGIPWLAPVVDQAFDLYETFKFERGAAKWAASFAGVIRTPDRNRAAVGPSTWSGEKSDGTPTQEVKENALIKLKDGEEVTPFPPGMRPSGSFMALLEGTLRDIAMGLNIPYGFLDMAGFSGANSRLEAEQVQRTIARYQGMLISKWLNPIIRDVLNQGVAAGHLPPPRNEQARRAMYFCDWRFGAHITADVGYRTQGDVLMLTNALTSAGAVVDQYGDDFEDVVDKRAQEAAYIRGAAERAGVPVEMIAPTLYPAGSELLANYEASLRPPPPPTVGTVGDKATGQIVEILEMVAIGTLPRQQAIQTLVTVYNMPLKQAMLVTPKEGSGKPPEAEGGGNGSNGSHAPSSKSRVKV